MKDLLDSMWEEILVAPLVTTERWQGVEANQQTRELLNVDFSFDMDGEEDLDVWREEIQPNLPWADDHFLERVGGEPLNPGVQWAKWPWGQSANKFRKDIFNHTYMERLWPKYARRTDGGLLSVSSSLEPRRYPEKDSRPKMGIAHAYGDLQNLVELLVEQPGTRQAWIPLFFPEDTGIADGGRKPCTLGYQFIMRGERLHIWYPLRSCDLKRHFQDDVYLAIRLLLWVLDQCRFGDPSWNKIKPGTYSMHMTSLHIFEGDKR